MNKKVILVVMAGLLCSRGAFAEEQHNTFLGEEVVITSSRTKELKANVTSNITVIDKDEISQSSAKDLSELLAEQSVGHIQKYPGALTTVGIRGFRSDAHGVDLNGKVVILLDGRRVGTGNVSQIALENVERIEIIRGPAAVQYGSAAIGGIVNVITLRGSGDPSFSLEQKYGTYEFNQSIAKASGQVGKVDYSGSFSTADKGDYTTGGGSKYYNTAYDDVRRGSINLGYELAQGHRFGLIYNHYETGKVGSPNYLVTNDLDAYTKSKNRSLDLSYEGETCDNIFSWMGRYYMGREDYTDMGNYGLYKRHTDYRGAQAQMSYNRDGLKITGGADWMKYEEHKSKYAPTSSTYENPAAFMMASYGFLDDQIIVSGGLRYDDFKVTVGDGLGDSRHQDNVAGSAGVAFKVSDGVKLRFNYAEGFKVPAAQELAADFYSFGTHYVGNPDLKPESSRSYEGGFDIDYADFSSSFTVFTTDFKDKIQTTFLHGDSSWENLGGATITGIESSLSWDYKPAGSGWVLTPHMNMVYLTEYKDDVTGEKLLYTPEWSSTVGFRVRDDHGLSGSFNLAYTGKTQVQNWIDWSGDEFTKGGFSVANMMVAKKFELNHSGKTAYGLTVSAEVNNIFDRDYSYVDGYPMQGRSLVVGMKLDI